MGEADEKRLQKAEMMKAFSNKRKRHWITVCLAAFLGQFGAQRIYLEQYKLAVGIFALFALTVILLVTNTAPTLAVGLAMSYVCVFAFEIFYGTKATDKKNDIIRKGLEDEFNLNIWD